VTRNQVGVNQVAAAARGDRAGGELPVSIGAGHARWRANGPTEERVALGRWWPAGRRTGRQAALSRILVAWRHQQTDKSLNRRLS
jgi:hypothetical protein